MNAQGLPYLFRVSCHPNHTILKLPKSYFRIFFPLLSLVGSCVLLLLLLLLLFLLYCSCSCVATGVATTSSATGVGVGFGGTRSSY